MSDAWTRVLTDRSGQRDRIVTIAGPWPTSHYTRARVEEAAGVRLPGLQAAVLRPVCRKGNAAYALRADYPRWEFVPNAKIRDMAMTGELFGDGPPLKVVLHRRRRVAQWRAVVFQGVGWGLGIASAVKAALVALDVDEERGGTWCAYVPPRRRDQASSQSAPPPA
jgi:hypothetical protein